MKKVVYLTIDDAPSIDFTIKVDYLDKHKIPAIFFCCGKDMEGNFDTLIYAIQKGFLIGSHAYSHTHFSALTSQQCFEEIDRTDQILTDLYKKAGISCPIKTFRFPYMDKGAHDSAEAYEANWISNFTRLDKKQAIQDHLQKRGYRQPGFEGITLNWYHEYKLLDDFDVYMTFDQFEYFLGNENAPYGLCKEEAILARIEEDTPEEGKSLNCLETADIILIHDLGYTTELFFKILDRYREKGFEFKMPGF